MSTVAGILIDTVTAHSTVQAGCRGAVVNVDATLVSGIASHTGTGVVVDAVNTGSSVLTRVS